ncbi:uncharacterized protein [Aristolochia californica]|uniref:uncharacterized protein n=1 Tax=Aristolochia californica TaxID=171875 RepID=UPI0035DA0152
MNWIQRKIYLYNVTFGLYMLEWWERYLFNILVIVLFWFIFHNGSRSASEFYRIICHQKQMLQLFQATSSQNSPSLEKPHMPEDRGVQCVFVGSI